MSECRWQPYAFKGALEQRVAPGVVWRRPGLPELGANDGAVAALGAFDGLHVGHQALIEAARAEANERGKACVAVTFDPDPAEVLEPSAASGRLLSAADRRAGLLSLGVDYVVAFSFTPELADLSPRSFVDDVLRAVFCPVSVHVGGNFRFGAQGAGNVSTLVGLGRELGFDVCAHELVHKSGESVSATRIRKLLGDGKLEEANELLGRCHYVRGTVRHGRGEGTSFGFPTANVFGDALDCMPAVGVYACYVSCDGKAWPAAANVGAPPTFSSRKPAFLEASLIGFSGNLYDEQVSVSFVKWLRGSRPFDSIDELRHVVLGNIEWVRENLGDHEIPL